MLGADAVDLLWGHQFGAVLDAGEDILSHDRGAATVMTPSVPTETGIWRRGDTVYSW
jgi:hypothetical protein